MSLSQQINGNRKLSPVGTSNFFEPVTLADKTSRKCKSLSSSPCKIPVPTFRAKSNSECETPAPQACPESPSTVQDIQSPILVDSSHVQKAPQVSLKKCPCRKSSDGQAWLLKCISCTQCWHNTCANLKGNLPKSTIDSLDMWQCPWCYTCPIAPPNNHKSTKTASALQNQVISDSILTKIEDTVKFAISNCQKEGNPSESPLFRNIEEKLSKLSSEVESFSKQQAKPPLFTNPSDDQPTNIESIREESDSENLPPQAPFEEYRQNFLSIDQANKLKVFLDKESFAKEGSREVVFYGQQHHYRGSKKEPKKIPAEIQEVLDMINTEVEYDINQVLVNKYTGQMQTCHPTVTMWVT